MDDVGGGGSTYHVEVGDLASVERNGTTVRDEVDDEAVLWGECLYDPPRVDEAVEVHVVEDEALEELSVVLEVDDGELAKYVDAVDGAKVFVHLVEELGEGQGLEGSHGGGFVEESGDVDARIASEEQAERCVSEGAEEGMALDVDEVVGDEVGDFRRKSLRTVDEGEGGELHRTCSLCKVFEKGRLLRGARGPLLRTAGGMGDL